MAVFLVAAGGTGGHLFPAEALAQELEARGHEVQLVTDERARRFGGAFASDDVHVVASATLSSRNPLALMRLAITLVRGFLQSRKLLKALKPAAVIGFGGYPTLPPLMAAQIGGVPTIVHEANAVLGRANRRLSRRARAVAVTFAETAGEEGLSQKAVVTGNPVRRAVLDEAEKGYEAPAPGQPFDLLVFGGSQGARIFADLVPAAVGQMAAAERGRLRIVQQCRPEDLARVRETYDHLGVPAELGSFFVDLPERIAGADLVIARSGASTVAEIAVIGRAAILIPFPHALDNDQKANAAALASEGAAVLAEQRTTGPVRLAQLIEERMTDPAGLAAMAEAARHAGVPDAVARLADLAEGIGGVSDLTENEA
ncbi:MAG: undecaprenyldiphospho-muramoylpentapeptide beta-N-acetylglucosaminyltransferase [Hyphomicrobiaceae bacterium]|nr:undecaprenyldiphospho-muramoylpentapeptide beta-N-acetylglucosaminyltransferase [Hyphomicrobiaceae bacterium]